MKLITKKQYNAVIERDEDGYYVASVPSLPGCHTQAKTLEALRIRLREVIELCLEHAAHDPEYRRLIQDAAYDPTFVALESVRV